MTDLTSAPERRPAPGSPPAAGRTSGRRNPLPSGRALVGGFLVAASALGVYVAQARAVRGPDTSYVVARHDLAVGGRLGAGDLELLPMDLPPVVVDNAVFSRASDLVGATVVAPVRRGELVQVSDVVHKTSGPDEVEVSFSVEVARAVGGTLEAGELVDVLATFGTGASSYTTAVVRQARVVATGRDRSALAAERAQTITLALAGGQDVLAVTHAAAVGAVTLVRATGTPGGPAGQSYRAPAAGGG